MGDGLFVAAMLGVSNRRQQERPSFTHGSGYAVVSPPQDEAADSGDLPPAVPSYDTIEWSSLVAPWPLRWPRA